jgi:hypothetical protein
MEMYRGVEAYSHEFLTLAVDGGEWLACRSGRFTPVEQPPLPVGW